MQESKEKIKSRMIKNASRLWGFQDTQTEGSFDPLVGMLFGSLAGELEKISGEIAGTESRVVEKLVELLTSKPITGPTPAHALVTAMPVQTSFSVDPYHQFYVYKKKKLPGNHGKTEDKAIFFTPTASFKLFNGRVSIMASGNKLFEIQEEQHKEVMALSHSAMPLQPSALWIGLELNEKIECINGLSLCFDLRSNARQDDFYNALTRAVWTINGHPMQLVSGFNEDEEQIRDKLDALLDREKDVSTKICHHVNRFYKKKFLSFTNENMTLGQLPPPTNFPAEFTNVFKQDELQKIDKRLYWIKAELPDAFRADVLDDVHCAINCFPVINRQLNSFTQTSREFINIIPLPTDDTFLDMNTVTNSEGKLFTKEAFSSKGEMEEGAYILRQGGVGRFDSRNAREVLNYLLELLRDESAAFAVLGTDMITSNLRELNQTIARLEQRLQDSRVEKEEAPYLMLKAHPEDDLVFVEFWSTQGVFANNIKVGNQLNIYEGSDINPGSLAFISPTIGGKQRKDTEERINTYRKTLLSHGRVVTAEDIKALCYEHFGKALEKVEVKKGIVKSPVINQGFVPCIDIHVKLDKRTAYEKNELEYLKDDLLIKLEEQAVNVWRYRCFVEGVS